MGKARKNISTPPSAQYARLTITEDAQNPEAPSPNAMAVDPPEEHIVEPNGTETDNIAIINPDAMDSDIVLASDCTVFCLPHPHPSRTPFD